MLRDVVSSGRALAICLLLQFAIAGSVQALTPPPLESFAREAYAQPLLHNVIVVCRKFRQGNKIITRYCEDGYECEPGDKCGPGPEMRRKMEEERARAKKELDDAQAELKKREAELEASTRELRRFARLGQDVQRPAYDDPRRMPSPQYGMAKPPLANTPPRYAVRQPVRTVRSSGSGSASGGGGSVYNLPVRLMMFFSSRVSRRNSLPQGDPERHAIDRELETYRQALKKEGVVLEEFVRNDTAPPPAAPPPQDASATAPAQSSPQSGDGVAGQNAATPPSGGQAQAAEPAPPPGPAAPELSHADTVWCNFMRARSRRGDLTGGQPFPEQCKGARDVLPSDEEPDPTIMEMDSADREEIEKITRSFQDQLPPAP